ncbi:MAG TPA: hypothetical protein VGH47_02100 [Xanthobacteraceae bacterium]
MSDDAVILVCARVSGKLLLPDNLVGPCAECGHKVQYRPHAPRPFLLRCIECTTALIKPGDEIGTTPRMNEDWQAYRRRKLQ